MAHRVVQAPMEVTVVMQEAVPAKTLQAEALQLLIFLTILLLVNWHLAAAAELDITEAQMAQAERPMAELAAQQNMETAKMASFPVEVAVLAQTDSPAAPVQMAAFTCAFIGSNLS